MTTKIIKNEVTFFIDEKSENTVRNEWWITKYQNFWEPYTFNIFDKFLSKDKSFVDVGAYTGQTALYGASKSKKVYAIEPDKKAFQILNNHLLVNPNINNVMVENCAISDNNNLVVMSSKCRNSDFGSSLTTIIDKKTFDGDYEIQSFTLKKFFQKNEITDCNFIKIDIEGSERLLFKSIENMNILKKKEIVLYLSLHPHLMTREQTNFVLNSIRDSYKFIYDINFNKITNLENYVYEKSNMHGNEVVCSHYEI